uniref:Uncharacterized protein n=1 Tax=Arundo donax TaxID=35708 RepID=A0A0A9BZG9_ARUDO
MAASPQAGRRRRGGIQEAKAFLEAAATARHGRQTAAKQEAREPETTTARKMQKRMSSGRRAQSTSSLRLLPPQISFLPLHGKSLRLPPAAAPASSMANTGSERRWRV